MTGLHPDLEPEPQPDPEPDCDRCADYGYVVLIHGQTVTFRPCPKCNNNLPSEDAA